jgi:hypothetical protein
MENALMRVLIDGGATSAQGESGSVPPRSKPAQTLEQKRGAVHAVLQEGELSGVFDGDAFASVRAELGLTRQ